MEIGQIIDLDKIGQRDFDPMELANALRNGAPCIVASWGARAWVKNKDLWLRFQVSGHHHSGHVYITLAWDDTFTLYFTSVKGKIVDKIENVYVDELVRTIDKRVEWIDKYKG